jgi:hypothetical protein
VEQLEKPGEAYSDRLRVFELDAVSRDEPGDRTKHRNPMISVRAHSPTHGAGRNPSHPEAIVARRDADAKGA